MNTPDYIQEAHRQLLNPEHYKPLTSDPTITYNKYIHHLIDQAWRLGIINDTTKESLQRILGYQPFTCYQKYTNQEIHEDQ